MSASDVILVFVGIAVVLFFVGMIAAVKRGDLGGSNEDDK